MTDLPKLIKAARRVGTPFIAIATNDPPATVRGISESFAENPPPIVQWDTVRGIRPINPPGKDMLARVLPSDAVGPVGQNPTEALMFAGDFERRTLFFMHNPQRCLTPQMDQAGSVMQAFCNLRDQYKSDLRTVCTVGPWFSLPAELQQDVMTIEEPLPDEASTRTLIQRTYAAAQAARSDLPELTEQTIDAAVSALAGLAFFPQEQTLSLAIDLDRGLDIPQLWTRKRATVNQTLGIEMLDDLSLPTFDEIGGLDEAKSFGADLFAGRQPPRVIVWLDEIEKMFGGLGAAGGAGDNTGATQDQLGVMLREQEFMEWPGLIAVGPPGAGKSLFARALGRTYGVPCIMLDLGALKGSLLGQSEERVRQVMKVIKAIAGKGGAFFVATCNDLKILPPELRRRYRYGIWYFDLPDAIERTSIWKVNAKKYGIDVAHTFNDAGWTGADSRNATELAWKFNKRIDDVARRIVPVSVSDRPKIEALRELAHDKFLSASYPGLYDKKRGAAMAGARAFGGD